MQNAKCKMQNAKWLRRGAPLTIAFIERSFAQPPRAFTLRQRDAKRRAKRGAEAPGQRTARGRLLRRVGRLCSLESPKLQVNVPLTNNHETRCRGKCSGDSCFDLLMAMTPCQTL